MRVMNLPSDATPFLLRMASKQNAQAEPRVEYDQEADELLVFHDGSWIPAIDAEGAGPVTKKKDIEKGEDEKDQW